jgi:hypothetical protein
MPSELIVPLDSELLDEFKEFSESENLIPEVLVQDLMPAFVENEKQKLGSTVSSESKS